MQYVVRLHGKCPAKTKAIVKKAATHALKKIPSSVAKRLLKHRKPPFILEISFVSATAIKKLNSEYRKKNRPTDVLSFSHLEAPPFPSPETQLGELFLCVKVIEKQAKEFEVTFREELARMTIHGTLHVFGYDHEKAQSEAKRMFRLQERLLIEIV